MSLWEKSRTNQPQTRMRDNQTQLCCNPNFVCNPNFCQKLPLVHVNSKTSFSPMKLLSETSFSPCQKIKRNFVVYTNFVVTLTSVRNFL